MRDKELHVADLVAKTPFPAGSKAHLERLIRTPGQILSLTEHLSFSNATAECTNESLGGSYTVSLRDSSHTCDASEYSRHVSGASSSAYLSRGHEFRRSMNELEQRVGLSRHVSKSSLSMCSAMPKGQADRRLFSPPVTPTDTMSRDQDTPHRPGTLYRKNSFKEALIRIAKDDLSRKVLDRNKGGSPNSEKESKPYTSPLKPLPSEPNSSFDKCTNNTIEFASEQDRHDEVFVEDKENLNRIVPTFRTSPLNCNSSSPPKPPLSLSPPSPFNFLSLNMNEDSRGSMSSSPKNNKVKRFSPDQLSPLKLIEQRVSESGSGSSDSDMSSPVTVASVAQDKVRSDVSDTARPEKLRVECSHQSWDSDILLDRPDIHQEEGTQSEMDMSQAQNQSEMETSQNPGNSPVVNKTSSPLSSGLVSPVIQDVTPSSFKIPMSQSGSKRKCSDSPGEESGQGRTQLTGDLTDLVISKKVRLDPDPGTTRSSSSSSGSSGSSCSNGESRSIAEQEVDLVISNAVRLDPASGPNPGIGRSSSSGSSEEEGRGYGFSTPVHQYSTPMSAVPQHLQQFKGMKAVKFVSPAGLTPVQHAELLTSPKHKLMMPFSLAELDTPQCPSTPPNFPSSPAYKTPHPTPHQTPLRTPKSMPRPRRITEPSRILGTPDYLAPELLRGQGHGKEVDWWALGACLYEFMTGVPPFHGETPEVVFDNILSLNMEWPEGEEELSSAARDCIMSLLVLDPGARADDAVLMTDTELTRDVKWAAILDTTPPFVPCPDSATDTAYFDAKNNVQGLSVSSVDI